MSRPPKPPPPQRGECPVCNYVDRELHPVAERYYVEVYRERMVTVACADCLDAIESVLPDVRASEFASLRMPLEDRVKVFVSACRDRLATGNASAPPDAARGWGTRAFVGDNAWQALRQYLRSRRAVHLGLR